MDSREIRSDTAPLHALVSDMLFTSTDVHAMRDPTRGGLATTLNELAARSRVAIRIREQDIPVRDNVRAACEILGLDPLYVANEGKLVAIVAPGAADALVACMRHHPHGHEARIIGEVAPEPPGIVLLATEIGGTRIVDMLFAASSCPESVSPPALRSAALSAIPFASLAAIRIAREDLQAASSCLVWALEPWHN